MSILWNVGDAAKVTEKYVKVIKTGTENCGNGVYKLKAGTPLNSSLVVANTANAKYIVAEDLYMYSNTPNQVRAAKVIESGYVDLAKAQAAWGGTYTDAAKGALATAGITLVGGQLPSGGGGTEPLAVELVREGSTLELEMAAVDIYNAYPNVYMSINQGGAEARFPILYVAPVNGAYHFGVSLSTGGTCAISMLSASSGDEYPSGTM